MLAKRYFFLSRDRCSLSTPRPLSKLGLSYPLPADADAAVDAVVNEYASYDAKEPRSRAKRVKRGVQWEMSDLKTHNGEPLTLVRPKSCRAGNAGGDGGWCGSDQACACGNGEDEPAATLGCSLLWVDAGGKNEAVNCPPKCKHGTTGQESDCSDARWKNAFACVSPPPQMFVDAEWNVQHVVLIICRSCLT